MHNIGLIGDGQKADDGNKKMTTQTLISRYNKFNGAKVSHTTLRAFHHDLQRHLDSDGHGPYAKELKGISERVSKALKHNFDVMKVQLSPIAISKPKPAPKPQVVTITREIQPKKIMVIDDKIDALSKMVKKLASEVTRQKVASQTLKKEIVAKVEKPKPIKREKVRAKLSALDGVYYNGDLRGETVVFEPDQIREAKEQPELSGLLTKRKKIKQKSVDGLPTSKPGAAMPGLPKNLSGFITAEELAGLNFHEIELDGEWKTEFNRLFTDTQVMAWGSPGSGKTVKLLRFAQYLAEKGFPVLYIANEELGRSTLTLKIREFNIGHKNLVFHSDIPNDISRFAVVFLDSVQTLGMDLKAYKAFRKANPGKLTIAVIQSTKDGDFRGGNDWEHEMDIAFDIVDRKVVMHKNRLDPEFSQKAEKIKIDNMVKEKTKKAKINESVKNKMAPEVIPQPQPQAA